MVGLQAKKQVLILFCLNTWRSVYLHLLLSYLEGLIHRNKRRQWKTCMWECLCVFTLHHQGVKEKEENKITTQCWGDHPWRTNTRSTCSSRWWERPPPSLARLLTAQKACTTHTTSLQTHQPIFTLSMLQKRMKNSDWKQVSSKDSLLSPSMTPRFPTKQTKAGIKNAGFFGLICWLDF